MLLDLAQSQGAVAADAGQHDADGVLALILGKGREERVDRPAAPPRRCRVRHAKDAAGDRQRGIGRDDEDPVRLDPRAVLGFLHRHRGLPRQQLGHEALVVRVEMLHQHERQSAIGRHVGEECLERVEPACRGADADDQRRVPKRRCSRGGRGCSRQGQTGPPARACPLPARALLSLAGVVQAALRVRQRPSEAGQRRRSSNIGSSEFVR